MQRLIQIRTYQLAPGTLLTFHRAFVEAAVPLLRAAGHDVVSFGPSLHKEDAYYLIRAYDDLDDLNTRQDAFYGSPQWARPARVGAGRDPAVPGCGTVAVSGRHQRSATPQCRRRGASGLSRIHYAIPAGMVPAGLHRCIP